MKYDICYPGNFNKSEELQFDKPKEINETMKHKKNILFTQNDENPSNMKATIYLYW